MNGSRAEDLPGIGLFDAYGIELEYMIVDDERLSVLPAADRILHSMAGDFVNEVETGALAWSNELALHVIEMKTNGPAPSLARLHHTFQRDVDRLNALLKPLGGRLMPTAMHPWMDPARETRLWPHGHSAIYQAFDRIFSCQGHGWANLQSMHINLPFADDDEFARLHAAVRVAMPLMPALAASSPVMEGRVTGTLDNRLDVYRGNSRRIPSVSGRIIPEPAYSRKAYETEILQRIYRDLAPLDPEGVLQHEWVNARGAIARFERNTIEIRVLDTQECPAADIAVAALIVEAVRALTEEHWCSLRHLQKWDSGPLQRLFLQCVQYADQAVIDDDSYRAAFGFPERGPCRARDLWQHLIETLVAPRAGLPPEWRQLYRLYLQRGSLARRIVGAVGHAPEPGLLAATYRRLCDCLAQGTLFDG
ncbi:MAG: glutamate-cysteine ligase family protein [Bradyrhizobium sp.]|uniref:carboxylate-amine ligase n=1 Tax=Bradyrhizobium sp. TaxID=376 RepID=UPI003D0FBB54